MDGKYVGTKYIEAKFALSNTEHYTDIALDDQPRMITEEVFLREYAWVVLSSGFRYSVVQKIFPEISRAFYEWDITKINRDFDECRETALEVFCNKKKINSILEVAKQLAQSGVTPILKKLEEEGATTLEKFSMIGPVTSLHLAKNIGIDVCKPDRHLQKICDVTNFDSVEELCRAISSYTGDKLRTIDLVLWTFAVTNSSYVGFFEGSGGKQ